MSERVPMEVVGVRIELPTNTPILLLRERDGRRYLPIWIGTPEATAIALALEGVETARPLTHDLMMSLIDALGADIERVDVTSLDEGTFYADLVIESDGEQLTISSRPSDAIALATRGRVRRCSLRRSYSTRPVSRSTTTRRKRRSNASASSSTT